MRLMFSRVPITVESASLAGMIDDLGDHREVSTEKVFDHTQHRWYTECTAESVSSSALVRASDRRALS